MVKESAKWNLFILGVVFWFLMLNILPWPELRFRFHVIAFFGLSGFAVLVAAIIKAIEEHKK